jgi:hypothetical protein
MITELKMVDSTIQALKLAIQNLILKPRLRLLSGTKLYSIGFAVNTVRITKEETDRSIDTVLDEIALVVKFFVQHLPEFSAQLSAELLPDFCAQFRDVWLNAAVPTKLTDMDPFLKVVGKVDVFVQTLKMVGWTQTQVLQDWVSDCAKLWWTRRRENDLTRVRDALSQGSWPFPSISSFATLFAPVA